MFQINQFVPLEIKNAVSGPKWEELKRTLLALMLTQRLDVFNEESSASGPWADLRPSTIKRKKGAYKKLHDKGVLRNSFTPAGGEGSQYREEIILDDLIELRTNVEYAAIHNNGGTINHPGTNNGFGKGIIIPAHTIDIEARPFNEFSDEQLAEVSETLEVFLNE